MKSLYWINPFSPLNISMDNWSGNIQIINPETPLIVTFRPIIFPWKYRIIFPQIIFPPIFYRWIGLRWKNRGQKALDVYREIGINQGFCLQHCWDKYQPLISIKIPPKVYRLFRTCISPVGAFDCIKFGHPGGKIEVRMQLMSIANFA